MMRLNCGSSEWSSARRCGRWPMRWGVRWLETKKDYRGEVYVFTDMAAEAWPEETLSKFAKSLDELPGANVYLIDVGAAEPKDVGLGRLKLSSERIAPSGLLQLNTDL